MDLEQLKTALDTNQRELSQKFEEMRKSIGETGEANKALQGDISKLMEEQKTIGSRLFDLEQGAADKSRADAGNKSFAADFAAKAIEGWNGEKARVEIGSFREKAAVTSNAASAGALVEPHRIPGILMPGMRRLTVRDLLMQGRVSSNSIEYVRENVFTNSAAIVAEGALKPESGLTFTKETANVRTIAHWIQASRQIMDDAAMLESYVNARMFHGLALVEEGQLLNGDGTGDNLTGLNTVATAYDTTLAATGDNKADAIAHAVYQVSDSEFEASGVVLHPKDWHDIALLKDANGNYILGGPQAFANRVLWGLPVVATKAQAQGTFTVGGFDMASQVWDRMDATIEISRHDRDNFVKNMLTILCEERLALAHYRPTAIIKGAFA